MATETEKEKTEEKTEETEKYILTQTVHFGFLKETFPQGCVFTVNRDKSDELLHASSTGKFYQDLRDLEICRKNGFFTTYSEKNLITQQKVAEIEQPVQQREESREKKPAPKMEVVKSDADMMDNDIDISWTKKKPAEAKSKNSDLEVIRERSTEVIRGQTVIRATKGKEDYEEVASLSKNIESVEDAAKSDVVVKTPTPEAKEAADKAKAKRLKAVEKNREAANEEKTE